MKRGLIAIIFLLFVGSVFATGGVWDLVFTLDEVKVSPGSDVKITGFAKNDLGHVLKKADVRVIIGNSEYKTKIKDGELSYKFEVPSTMESGDQKIIVYVEDEIGNVENKSLDLNVLPIPTEIEFSLPKSDYKPLEEIEIVPLLKDQAGDRLNVELNVLLKQGRKIILSQTVPSGEEMRLQIPMYTLPGDYNLVLKYKDVEVGKDIKVEEHVKTKISIGEQNVILENIGNVKNKDSMEVFVEDQLILTDLVSLAIAEKHPVDLSNELQTGTYKIKVTYGGEEKTFEDVNVVGKKRIRITWFYKFIVFFLIVLLIYTLWDKKKEFRGMLSFGKGKYESGGPSYIRREPKKEEEKSYRYPRFKNKKEEVKDFKKRILKGIKETEKKRRKEEGDEGSLFKMFD